MQKLRLNIFFALALFLFASCAKEAALTDRIPGDMPLTVKADANRLGGKVLWEKIKDTDWRDIWKDKPDGEENGLRAEETGINILSDVYLGAVFSDDRQSGCGSIFFSLSDAEKFEQFLLKKFPGTEIQNEGDFKIISSAKDEGKITVLFASDFGAILFSESETDLAAFQNKVMNLAAENSLSGDEEFGKATAESSDISGLLHLQISEQEADFKDFAERTGLGKMHFSLNFSAGEINFENRIFANDELLAGLRERSAKLEAPHLAEKDKVLQFVQAALPPVLTEALVAKFAGLKTRAFLMGAGLTIEQLNSAFSGQAALSIGPGKVEKSERITYEFDEDFNKIEKKESVEQYRPDLRLEVFGSETLEKLPAAYERNGMLKKDPNGIYSASFLGYEIYTKYADNRLGISSSQEIFTDNNRHEVTELALKYPFVVYSNFRKSEEASADLYKMISPETAKQLEQQAGLFDTGLLTGEAAADCFLIKGKYKLINSEENSLIVLLEFAKKQAEAKEKQEVL